MDSHALNKLFTRANWGFVLSKWVLIFYGTAFLFHGLSTWNLLFLLGSGVFFYLVWVLFLLEGQFYREYYLKFKAKNKHLRAEHLKIRFRQRIESEIYFKKQAHNLIK